MIDEETGKVMEYWDLLKDEWYREIWSRAGTNKYGRLFQAAGTNSNGAQRVKGTNTCHWIPKSAVPKNKEVTYALTVVDIRPEKSESNKVRITVAGDCLDYFGETSSKTASQKTAKILINSILSTKNAKFMSINISNF